MPIGKDIHLILSKKIKDRQKRKGKPTPPPVINNFQVNKPTFAKSRNLHPNPEEKTRTIGPNEGKPAVNSSANVEGLIHKGDRPKSIDPGLASITPEDLGQKKKRGRPKKKPAATKKSKENNNT